MKPPKYIMFKDKTTGELYCAMRLLSKEEREGRNMGTRQYWRDAGLWGINYKWKDGKLFTQNPYRDLKHLNNVELVEITKEQWRKDNEGYV